MLGLTGRSPDRFPSERTRKVIPCRRTEDGKGAGTNSRKSGTRILEAESITGRAGSTGRCVKLNACSQR